MLDAGELDHQYYRGERHVHRCTEDRERAQWDSRPGQAPRAAQDDRHERTDRQSRRQQATFGARAQTAAGHQDLDHQQQRRQADAQFTVKAQLCRALAITEHLRQIDGDAADQDEVEQ